MGSSSIPTSLPVYILRNRRSGKIYSGRKFLCKFEKGKSKDSVVCMFMFTSWFLLIITWLHVIKNLK